MTMTNNAATASAAGTVQLDGDLVQNRYNLTHRASVDLTPEESETQDREGR